MPCSARIKKHHPPAELMLTTGMCLPKMLPVWLGLIKHQVRGLDYDSVRMCREARSCSSQRAEHTSQYTAPSLTLLCDPTSLTETEGANPGHYYKRYMTRSLVPFRRPTFDFASYVYAWCLLHCPMLQVHWALLLRERLQWHWVALSKTIPAVDGDTVRDTSCGW